MEEDFGYPKEDEDLKRRVAGEVLRSFERKGKMPPVPEVVEIIEGIAARVRTRMRNEELPLRRIDLAAEVAHYLRTPKDDPGT